MDKKLKILIVEDEFLIALDIDRQLRKLGYDLCEPAASGEEAIRAVRDENPDIILMDVNLAGKMNGLETYRKISKHSNAAFVFMTGHVSDDTMAEINNLNPLACIVKPVLVREVHNVISNWQTAHHQ